LVGLNRCTKAKEAGPERGRQMFDCPQWHRDQTAGGRPARPKGSLGNGWAVFESKRATTRGLKQKNRGRN